MKRNHTMKMAALLAVGLALMAGAAEKPKFNTTRYDVPQGKSLRLKIKFNVASGGDICLIQSSTNAVQQVRWQVLGQKDEHEFIAYANRGARSKAGTLPPKDDYPNCGIRFLSGVKGVWGSKLPCLNFDYYFLPFFDMSRGLYAHKQIVRDMPRWKEELPQFDRREMKLAFAHDPVSDRVTVWLDDQFAGHLQYKGPVVKASVTVHEAAQVTFEPYVPDHRPDYSLPPLPARAADCLKKDAKLTLDKKIAERLDGFRIWDPSESIDQGRHCRTTYHRDFGWDPMFCRTPWANGPEYMQWTIPAGFYLYVDVLCADIPETNKTAVVGSSLTRFGASNQESFATAFTDLATAATNPAIRVVGTLTYKKDGKTQTTPVYIVRQKLNIGKILHFLNDKPIYGKNEETGATWGLPRLLRGVDGYLDFEFVGAGTAKEKPRSSVQVFGARFVSSPYAFDISESERGNIFEDDERPETGIEVKALRDNSRGKIAYTIRDDNFKELRTGEQAFELAKRGDVKRLSFDLSMPEVGWYMLDYTFYDDRGREITMHKAAFTLLGKNDREAGFESPYACWPQGTGYEKRKDGTWGFPQLGRHNCNPNRAEVAKWMHKAGYHSGWAVPCRDEDEFPDYQLTLSAFSKYCNGIYWPANMRYNAKDAVTISNRIEEAVAYYREEMKRYPYCKTIQILHEQGWKGISQELLGKPAVRGEYKGLDGLHLVFWATELAKRLRQEFPGYHLQIGNGSSSCEMIATLCREGFDLDLVDTLGIESKGFQTMPELANNLESPGMLWALKATAARFGYTNKLLNACSEYVFRPERPYHVAPDKTYRQRMQVTDFTLRDYLISLAHGCWTISTGHPEDCNTQYYDTNWGAGGQCTFFPYSYPKRMFTGLATLTKVMDKVSFSRCLDTGANATYCVEFKRDRRVKDYAYAYWAAYFPAELKLTFPKGAQVTAVDWQGHRKPLALDAKGSAVVTASSTPAYLISAVPVAAADFVRSVRAPLPGACTVLFSTAKAKNGLIPREKMGSPRKGEVIGTWEVSDCDDAEWSEKVLETRLVRTEPAPPEVVLETGRIWLGGREEFNSDDFDEIGIWVRGNGGFGKLTLGLSSPHCGHNLDFGYRSYICHDGWQLLRTKLPDNLKDGSGRKFRVSYFMFSDCRNALNPRDMVPVRNALRFGPIVGIKLNKGVTAFDLTEKIDEAMKQVDEKDL